MVETFGKFSWFWTIGGRGDQWCRPAGGHLSDWRADVCSRQDTRPALMRLIVDRRVSSGVEATCPRHEHGSACLRVIDSYKNWEPDEACLILCHISLLG
jgi:hypothetical protein